MERLDQIKAEAKAARQEAFTLLKAGKSSSNPKYRKLIAIAKRNEELVEMFERAVARNG